MQNPFTIGRKVEVIHVVCDVAICEYTPTPMFVKSIEDMKFFLKATELGYYKIDNIYICYNIEDLMPMTDEASALNQTRSKRSKMCLVRQCICVKVDSAKVPIKINVDDIDYHFRLSRILFRKGISNLHRS